MIVTVTPAPAIDWTVWVEHFQLGRVNRTERSTREPSGKGVNISWALHRAGVPTRAVLPAGGATGSFMAEQFARAGVPHVIMDTGRDVRTNITLITRGQPTKINEPGSPLSPDELESFRQVIHEAARGVATVVLCGRLPPGVPNEFMRDVAVALKESGVEVVVDTSGAALRRALEACPDLIKPNVNELAELAGFPIRTFGDVVRASRGARDRGAGAVLASLGVDGAVLVDAAGELYARADDVPLVNPVGAGDAFLAGYLVGGQAVERLTRATLWAASAVAHPTTLFPIREEFAERISVGPVPDPKRQLAEPSHIRTGDRSWRTRRLPSTSVDPPAATSGGGS